MTTILHLANIEVTYPNGHIETIPINIDSVQLFMDMVKRLGGKAEVVSVIDEVREAAKE